MATSFNIAGTSEEAFFTYMTATAIQLYMGLMLVQSLQGSRMGELYRNTIMDSAMTVHSLIPFLLMKDTSTRDINLGADTFRTNLVGLFGQKLADSLEPAIKHTVEEMCMIIDKADKLCQGILDGTVDNETMDKVFNSQDRKEVESFLKSLDTDVINKKPANGKMMI